MPVPSPGSAPSPVLGSWSPPVRRKGLDGGGIDMQWEGGGSGWLGIEGEPEGLLVDTTPTPSGQFAMYTAMGSAEARLRLTPGLQALMPNQQVQQRPQQHGPLEYERLEQQRYNEDSGRKKAGFFYAAMHAHLSVVRLCLPAHVCLCVCGEGCLHVALMCVGVFACYARACGCDFTCFLYMRTLSAIRHTSMMHSSLGLP